MHASIENGAVCLPYVTTARLYLLVPPTMTLRNRHVHAIPSDQSKNFHFCTDWLTTLGRIT